MRDLKSTRLICLKGGLFLLLGVASAALLIARASWREALLLAVCVWSFCRAYYFAFYVIEHYVDSSYRFSGLFSFARYALKRPKKD